MIIIVIQNSHGFNSSNILNLGRGQNSLSLSLSRAAEVSENGGLYTETP